MDGDSIRLCIVFIFLVIISGYFSGAESAYSLVNKIRIKTLADSGDKSARKVFRIISDFDRALTAILIGTNVMHIAAASVATILAARLFDGPGYDADSVALVGTFVTTGIIFLFGEMIPKSFAGSRPETVSRMYAGSMKLLMKLLTPLIYVFSAIIKFFEKLFTKDDKPSITEDELYDIIDTAEEEGVMNEEQSNLFKSALDFSQTTAEDVMTVRDDITAIDISLPTPEIIDIIQNTNHTRLPVYSGSLDNIIGYLQIRTFLRDYLKNSDIRPDAALIPPFFVSSDARIRDLLTIMRRHKFYLAVVSDEMGYTKGIVTIEDFLEELVGEIWDEDDVVDDKFIKLGGNRFLVSIDICVDDAFDRMNCRPPDKIITGKTVSEWIVGVYGHFPEDGDSFIYRNLVISKDETEHNTIDGMYISVYVRPETGEKLVPAE